MRFSDLKQPLAKLTSGQVDENFPEALASFKEDFFASPEFVGWYVDESGSLWALVYDVDLYQWQPGDGGPGDWLDAEDF